MSAIIAAIIAIVGPIIAEWLKKWLENILSRAATRLEGRAFGNDTLARSALLDEAIGLTPRFAFARRALLRKLKATNGDLSPDDVEAIRDLAGAAENE